ncbi:MFS transporter [Streptomyces coeruleoprunus]|uniref:alpha-amylase n=1 Tax=Streptomyces coeruleoprunus TaxID=285563 RepID=A0ABV9XCR7_9ACTN
MGGITLAKDERAGRAAAEPDDDTAPPSPGGPPATPAETAPAPGPGPRHVGLVLCGLVLALVPAALQQLAVGPALPAVAADLPGPSGHLSWTVIAYLLTATVAVPLHGKLGDLYGRKGVFQFALVLLLAGSALAGWARTLDELVAFRALQGLGAGGVLTGVQAITADLVPARRRGRHLGLLGAAFAVASVGGPLLGGHLTELASWRWVFYVTLPPGLLALAVVAAALKLPPPTRRARPDVLGALLLAAASTCLILLIAWAGEGHPWNSRVTIGLVCGAIGTTLLYLAVAACVPEPVIPLRLLRDPVFLVSALVGTVLGTALLGVATCLPVFLQAAGGATVPHTALLLLPLLGSLTVASLVSGHLISRTGHYTVYAVIGAAVAVVGMWLLSQLETGTPTLDHSVWQAVLGTGIGLLLPVLVLAVQNAAPPADLGAATAAHTFFRQIGACGGVTVLGTLFADRLTGALADRLPAGTPAPAPGSVTPQMLGTLPPAVRDGYVQAYADAAPRILLHLVPVLALGLFVAFFLKEKPLVSDHTPAAGSVPPARTPAPVPPPGLPVPPPEADRAPGPEAASFRIPPEPEPAPFPLAAGPHLLPLPGVPVCGTVRHHDGSGVPGAALTLIDVHGRQTGRGASGTDGRYALSTPATGTYVMIAAAAGHQPQAVTVTVGDRPVELDVFLGGAGRLTGTVVTADRTPVHDAAVTLTDARGEVVATTRTGPDGGYALTELVAGEYTLAVGAPGLRPAALPVGVHAARETRQDVELAGGAVLRGTVRAPGGRPVEDARVTLLDAAGNVVDTLTTGPDGIFRFVDLTAGAYTVIASGYPPVATVLQVAGGGRAERDVQLGHGD